MSADPEEQDRTKAAGLAASLAGDLVWSASRVKALERRGAFPTSFRSSIWRPMRWPKVVGSTRDLLVGVSPRSILRSTAMDHAWASA
jgi:hypothetical protein